MPETITGFFVDPENNTAEPCTIEKSLDAYYELLQCDLIDIVSRSIGEEFYYIICDDEALLKADPIPSAIDRKGEVVLCGPIFIVNDDGECDVCSLTPDDIKHLQKRVSKFALRKSQHSSRIITAITGLPY